MRQIKKKIVTRVAMFALMFIVIGINGISAYASENNMINISTVEPKDARGISIPTEIHDFSDGKLYYDGSSKGQVLYTNKKFTGYKDYIVYVHNTSENEVEVKVKTAFKTYKTFTVPGKSEKYVACSIGDSSVELYLRFDASNRSIDVDGYVTH